MTDETRSNAVIGSASSLCSGVVRKCVSLPPQSEWNDINKSLPADGETVLAWIEFQGWQFVCQVEFIGGAFAHEFRMGDNAVYATHWLSIGVIHQADVIDGNTGNSVTCGACDHNYEPADGLCPNCRMY